MAEITLTDSNWEEEVIKSDLPVIVDLWAEWCGPCKMIAPILSQLADEYSGKMKVGKLNVDDFPAIAQKFDIVSIPTILVFQKGELKDRITGALAKNAYEHKLAPYLKENPS